MISYLDTDDVIIIHNSRPELCYPVINRDNLESAVGRPAASFGGVERFPLLVEKAAALLHGLAASHGFYEGNKRTAWLTTMVFLNTNGSPVYSPQQEAADFTEAMVRDNYEVDYVALWLAERFVK